MVFISLLYYKANVFYMYLVAYIWFGIAYGMMLQYGRFCFASASRDLFAAGVPRMAVGILIALIFFSVIQATLAATNMSTFHPAPFGIHTLLSGMIFGVGMVLAGGCASGSLYKIGEGNGTSILSILGISFGQAIFVDVGGPFLKLVPESWVASSAAKHLPPDKVTSWFDYYLVRVRLGQALYPAFTHPGLLKCPPGRIKILRRRRAHQCDHTCPGSDRRHLCLLHQERFPQETR